RFPNIAAALARYGFDLTAQPIPVVPAAHYMCGGVPAALDGRTSLRRLLAIGEVACTGLHGANRLASNSLLEGLVTAHRAGARGAAGPGGGGARSRAGGGGRRAPRARRSRPWRSSSTGTWCGV